MSSNNNSIIIINNTDYSNVVEVGDDDVEEEDDASVLVSGSGPSYVTNVTVSNMCLCCTGQQARRCSVNIGESAH